MTARSDAATRRSYWIMRSSEPHRAAERQNLLAAECAELPGRQAAEVKRAARDALEAPYLDADAREQTANLPVLPLGERHRDEREVAVAAVPRARQHAHRLHARALRAALGRGHGGEEHALRELRERAVRQRALDRHAVFLGDFGARGGEAGGEFAVIREKHEPRRVSVQPPDGVDAVAGW